MKINLEKYLENTIIWMFNIDILLYQQQHIKKLYFRFFHGNIGRSTCIIKIRCDYLIILEMNLQKIVKGLQLFTKDVAKQPYIYGKSSFLFHHTLQSLYEVISPDINIQFEREKIYFIDGGHICLDWVNKHPQTTSNLDVPVLLVMHGMTGSTNSKYIKAIAEKAKQSGYTCLCLNSRGFNSPMTSPVPFIGLQFHELQSTLQRIKYYYPNRPLHMLGMSLGGNYLMRYLIANYNQNNNLLTNLKSLILVSPPFDIKYVIYNMNVHYQRLFLKYYIKYLVQMHDKMNFWKESGVVDFQHMKASQNLIQFHQRITEKIVGEPIDEFFDRFKVEGQQIEKLPIKSLIISSKDDPMVNLQTLPINHILRNKQIKLILTDTGAHMCWYEGFPPQRWYPRPVFQFIKDVQNGKQVQQI